MNHLIDKETNMHFPSFPKGFRLAYGTARVTLACMLTVAGLSAHGGEPARKPEGYPGSSRVSIVVPYAPGGTTDIVARLIAEGLGKRWGAPVIVDNKPGAGGNIGAEYVARSKGDGHTLLVGATALSNAPALSKSMRFDVAKDLAPISLMATTPLVLMVSKKSGIQSIPELVARLKSKPEALTYGSSGVGTSINLSTLMFLNRINAKALHVLYKGSGPALTALVSGEIDVLFDNYATAMPFVAGGQVKALALTSSGRGNLRTDLPTLAQSGLPNFESLTWIGMLAPAGTPEPIITWVNSEVAAVLGDPAVLSRLVDLGFSSKATTPEAFGGFIREEMSKAQRLVQANNIPLE
ncbi:tripartite tricarboxylate transporter substrate binding protein [Variovorax sp. RT4R15]|uniref:tripartite tricarboxylate transporter substrate binding protein n=1 Tax=Variovorax sp. RT4R15 TaxID=3443737 RepID=UPI003F45C9BF